MRQAERSQVMHNGDSPSFGKVCAGIGVHEFIRMCELAIAFEEPTTIDEVEH